MDGDFMSVFYSSSGEKIVASEKPEGFYTEEEWISLNQTKILELFQDELNKHLDSMAKENDFESFQEALEHIEYGPNAQRILNNIDIFLSGLNLTEIIDTKGFSFKEIIKLIPGIAWTTNDSKFITNSELVTAIGEHSNNCDKFAN